MAKKSYTSIKQAWDATVRPIGSDKSTFTFKGNNSAGTPTEVTITVDDYFFQFLIKDMVNIQRARVSVAMDRLNSIRDAVNK